MSEKEHKKNSITSRLMHALEVNAEYFGVSRLQLMENAGHAVALEIASRFQKGKSVCIFCGLGGNGGDGFVTARYLASMGYNVEVILAGKAENITHKTALDNWKVLRFLDESISTHETPHGSHVPDITAEIVVDALLGTGTKGKLRPPILQLVEKINATEAFRVAVDVPTGIDTDTGEILGKAVKADLTLTFHKTKAGFKSAKEHVGNLVVRSIGLPRELEDLAGPGDIFLVTKPRPLESHKGDFGRLLVIGGSETFSGAPALVALAALRTGIDLVYVAAPVKAAHVISSMSPNLITVKLDGEHLNTANIPLLKKFVQSVDAVVVGPGLGLHAETKDSVKSAIDAVENAGKPMLLDADGLKAFAGFKRSLKVPSVLTPHAGEYALLASGKFPEDTAERISRVQKTAAELNAVVLLKGSVDIICDGQRCKRNFTGNPGMTVGGTGDVLSGIIGAFLAQQADPFEAAVAGAFVNGAAADLVYEEKGYHMVSTDLLDWIPMVLENAVKDLKVKRTSAKAS